MSSETDQLMSDGVEIKQTNPQQHYYTFNTVGSLFHNTLSPHVIIRPEVLQTDFEYTFDLIRPRLQVSYRVQEYDRREELRATFNWSKPTKSPEPIASRLAGIYFPLLAEHIVPCYNRIASEKILGHVLHSDKRTADGLNDELTEGVARFRSTTAAIVISLVSCLSSTEFKTVRHSTLLELTSEYWLEDICKTVDHGFCSSLNLKDAVYLLAAIHAGGEYEKDWGNLSNSQNVICWRNGMYCVLPSLLLDIEAMHYFPTAFMASQSHSHQESPDQQSVIEMNQSPWIGLAHCSPPNKLLHLSIERPLHYSDPDICFTGRVDGNVVGTTSILDVLVSVSRSVSIPSECDHRDVNDISNVLNVSASRWIKDGYSRPCGSAGTPAYLAVKEDTAWALFAAGQSSHFHNVIVVRCLICAKELLNERIAQSGNDGGVLIGFQ
ncbi:uncharacterized protein TRUGW13939_01664 [Talaromyces rugulosus]|uniref:Uncharacterized protein n=1 Tax=Talaromyces rugulosus TaxID=121627 RepID=A0A7H8QKY2_TALRU|nr:uncharacterized protein TRUGW13939_01664 [Talaromyces rugulosus]QKX54577.1 hypothetical protein TRUGW13939_01664 [Talaromyces rugulosus]